MRKGYLIELPEGYIKAAIETLYRLYYIDDPYPYLYRGDELIDYHLRRSTFSHENIADICSLIAKKIVKFYGYNTMIFPGRTNDALDILEREVKNHFGLTLKIKLLKEEHTPSDLGEWYVKLISSNKAVLLPNEKYY